MAEFVNYRYTLTLNVNIFFNCRVILLGVFWYITILRCCSHVNIIEVEVSVVERRHRRCIQGCKDIIIGDPMYIRLFMCDETMF